MSFLSMRISAAEITPDWYKIHFPRDFRESTRVNLTLAFCLLILLSSVDWPISSLGSRAPALAGKTISGKPQQIPMTKQETPTHHASDIAHEEERGGGESGEAESEQKSTISSGC